MSRTRRVQCKRPPIVAAFSLGLDRDYKPDRQPFCPELFGYPVPAV